MNMLDTSAISCQKISKRFLLLDSRNAWRLLFGGKDIPTFTALNNVSFDVPKGEFTGILGANGAGKSTLLRIIGGVYASDSGTVDINGRLSGLYELGIAGNQELTGRQYAERLLKIQGASSKDLTTLITDIHEFSELQDRFEDPLVTYSAGMAARLFFSTATAGHYDVYLLDEILSVGDQHFRSKCWRRLRERVSNGASGIFVTHDWAAVVTLCKTAHVLQKGEIVFSGPAQTAVRRYLYGDANQEEFQKGIAHFCKKPTYAIETVPGSSLHLTAEVEIETSADVGIVFVIERLQPGYGWETMLMSRAVTQVGSTAGLFDVAIEVPNLPLSPGSYQISLHLVMPDPSFPNQRIMLDGFSWLNGTGLDLNVPGNQDQGLTLPSTWEVKTP